MEISIENAEQKFEEHFSQDKNDRILFSGKFGTGKSYFLKKYFENRDDKYNLFWLSPVNYVVGANQDIFEWIKIDIAKELLKQSAFSKNKKPFSTNLLLQTHLYNNAGSIFNSLLTGLANTTLKKVTGFDFLKTFKKEIEEYTKLKETAELKSKSDFEVINNHIDSATQTKGSIYEDDLTTRIIRASIEMQKHNSGKENILVIDDLDRLDPEHIFRILNILSTHNDHFDTNKFGFDKVIVVCDIDNIKHIYEYKYGEKVDFEGYIEKFFTYEPFYFTIYDAIVAYCRQNYFLKSLPEQHHLSLAYILTTLYLNKILKIRNLKKIYDYKTPNHVQYTPKNIRLSTNGYINQLFVEISNTDIVTIDFNKHHSVELIKILSIATGGSGALMHSLRKMQKIYNKRIDDSSLKYLIKSFSLMHLIANNSPNYEHVFFNYNNNAPSPNLKNPETTFLGQKIIIDIYWDSHNKYNGGNDYFDQHIILNQKTVNNPTTSDLFNSLISIVKYLTSEKVL